MASVLLETKLFVPRARAGLVPRPRLRARLDRGAEAKLTLVSAPAGFGKTRLLAEWLAAAPTELRSVAWLSLDASDNQSSSFWTYAISALQTMEPAVGRSAIALVQSSQPPPIESILAALLNDLNGITHELVLVLDDYHVIDTRDIHDGIAFLLEHLPPQMHLMLATRADPALPLARLRGRGELVEIRAADLRFTPAEAAAYLNEVMGLDLTERDMAALERRTEGWIAALQLAALSMQGRDDVAGFIANFTGDDRYIVDYLVEEVLQRQPKLIRSFLLQTSILGRLNGSLCDAVTDQSGGKAMLEVLERGNLFVVPLDDRRQWYRYHHLFADVLRAHLVDEQPEVVALLHRRASDWYEQRGERSEAIRHALAGDDFERAANLIELSVPAIRRERQEAKLLGWLTALPDNIFDKRPVLTAAYAWANLIRGEVEGVEERLRDAERWLNAPADSPDNPSVHASEMVVADEDEFRGLPGLIALLRAGRALALGNLHDTMQYAQGAVDLVPEDDHLRRGSAAGLLGLALWTKGDLEAAHRTYAECMVSVQRAGHLSDAIGCAIALADIRIAQGRLHDAMRTYEQALQLAAEHGEPVLRGAADLHVGISEILREYGDLTSATQHLQRSTELGEQTGLPQNPYRWCVSMARLREAEGDLDAALELLREAERLYVSDFFPNVRPVAAVKARIWVKQGMIEEAMAWAREQGLALDDDLSYLREFEHITLAGVLFARNRSDHPTRAGREVMEFLARLLHAAESGERLRSIIEVLILQAVAHQAEAHMPAALMALERALALAEPEGYVRMFVDQGPPVAMLLDAAAKHGIAPTYVRHLLAAFGNVEVRAPAKQDLIEPLSERELDVLRLLETDLDGPAIANELMVSLNTMRTHSKNIYAKLGVNSRRAAIRRAEELQLLTRRR